MSKKMQVGIIGCGDISGAYLKATKTFNNIEIIACADINMYVAKQKAQEYNIKALTVEELLLDETIEIVLNLTIPAVHAQINLKALNSDKHVYCEKPFAVLLEEGKQVIELAKEKGLYVGCAPDTFLGGSHQTCRKVIDDNWIGTPIAGTALLLLPGHEHWHPSPAYFYKKGAGPIFDMGPYYITALINLLGPVKRVCASTSMTFKERVCSAEGTFGQRISVEVPTHVAGVMDFESGTIITIITSYDVQKHAHNHIEIYGASGSLIVPDPNSFGGEIKLSVKASEWSNIPFSHGYTDNMRSIGVADMAYSIQNGCKNRCSGELAYHVLEIMHAFDKSSTLETHVKIESTCDRPRAFPLNLENGTIG